MEKVILYREDDKEILLQRKGECDAVTLLQIRGKSDAITE